MIIYSSCSLKRKWKKSCLYLSYFFLSGFEENMSISCKNNLILKSLEQNIFMVSLLKELKRYIMDLCKYLRKERGHSMFMAKQLSSYVREQWLFVSQIPLCLQNTLLNAIRTVRVYFHIVWSLTHLLRSHMLIYIYMHTEPHKVQYGQHVGI